MGPVGCQPGTAPAVPGPVAPGPQSPAPCASSPCLHGSTCRPSASSYFCQCGPGWQGPRCAQREDHCVQRPCLNGATCLSTDQVGCHSVIRQQYGSQGRVCECSHGFTGDDCAEEVQACGGEFNSPAGFIDFPVGTGTFYEHSVSCDYIIRVSPGMVVNLTFTEFRCHSTLLADQSVG